MAALKLFVAVAAIAVLVELAKAKNITVGSGSQNGGWDLSTNLQSWASTQSFVVGDNLIFSYDPTQHDVLEVTKANYGSCQTSGPIKTYTSGNDVIPLSSAVSRYFICGKPGHCQGGMKVEIDTVAASTTPPGSPSPPPSPPGTTPSPPPPPGSSGANGHGLHAKAAVGFGFGMLMLLAL